MIDTIEKRANINVMNYLGNGKLTPIQTKTESNGKYYGESNGWFGRWNGRGIYIFNAGDILIASYENGSYTGNYIIIYGDGVFRVGEFYLKDGKRRDRGTWYYINGKEEQYDNNRWFFILNK